jgi:hypothetical protein
MAATAAVTVPHTPTQPVHPHQQWWDYARRLARALHTGYPPPPLAVYGPVLHPGEDAHLGAAATYSRHTAGDGTYQHLNVLAVGAPALTISALAAQAVLNHRRRNHARAAAQPGWRGHHTVDFFVTSERLLCDTAAGWLSFWWPAVTEFYPDPLRYTLTLGFGDCPALRLTGMCVPALTVLAAASIYRDPWANDPRLAVLLQ